VIMAFWRVYYHLVWATKNREDLIQPEIEDLLYGYIVRKASELGVYVYAINGWYDHVHVVASIPPKHAAAYVVKRVKGASSHYVNNTRVLDYQFAWQRGYGVLTLGERQRSTAEKYVYAQKTHHQQATANAWLERSAEFDEGPVDIGITAPASAIALHDQREDYDAWGVSPF
jgi:putative transposase